MDRVISWEILNTWQLPKIISELVSQNDFSTKVAVDFSTNQIAFTPFGIRIYDLQSGQENQVLNQLDYLLTDLNSFQVRTNLFVLKR